MRAFILALLIASPAAAGESWYTAMTPLDSRPPLPKPTEPDADTQGDGRFRTPAPAVVKVSAKKPAAKPKASTPKAESPNAGCKCEPCECAVPKAQAPAVDPRLTRDANGYYYGTAPTGQSYYSTDPNAVLRAIAMPTVASPAYCTTGTCPR